MKARACCLIAVCTFSTTYVTRSIAQPTTADKALATRLYADAEKLMAAGDYAAACPKYGESQQRDPQLGTLLHLADCYEKAGKFMSAWVSFNEAVEAAARKSASGVKETRGQTARERAAALEGKLSNLVIVVTNGDGTPGLEIKQNGSVVGRAVWGTAVPVDPGSYVVTAQAPGKKPWTKTAEVASNGLKVEVNVPVLEDEGPAQGAMPPSPAMPPPGALGPTPPMGTASPPAPDSVAPTASPQRLIGWIVAGAGVVGLGVGTGFGLMSKSKTSERDEICPSSDCPRSKINQYLDAEKQAQSNATVSNVAFVVGGVAIAAGVVLVLTAPSQPANAAGVTAHIAPWAGPNSAGAMMGGAW